MSLAVHSEAFTLLLVARTGSMTRDFSKLYNGESMGIKEFREYRNLPFVKRGMKVECIDSKEFGTISGSNRSMNINVKLAETGIVVNRHPTWMMRYFDDNNKVIAEYMD